MREADERANISAGRLASPSSVQLRARNAMALRLAVAAAGLNVVQPRVRPRAIRRVLHQLAPTLDTTTLEAKAVRDVLARTPRAFGLFCARNPDWLREQVVAFQKTNGSPP